MKNNRFSQAISRLNLAQTTIIDKTYKMDVSANAVVL